MKQSGVIEVKQVANGIWKLTLGNPEEKTPTKLLDFEIKHDFLANLQTAALPFDERSISFRQTARGCVVEIPMKREESIYGFGLQLYSVNQAGRKRRLKVNSDPPADTGESHAPVPFYVSTAGYGIYIDTARYVSVYCGTSAKKGSSRTKAEARKEYEEFSENAIYALKSAKEDRSVIIDLPTAQGVDLYLFAGPDLKTAIQRYNLFSGGGCLPPLWGLGMWYRIYGGATEQDVYRLADEFRESRMPVDVFGLEPGWQTHSYSCSFKWDLVRFPNPVKMLDYLNEKNYKVNLWEHLFVHPTADIYQELEDYSGDYEVWGGLVPDFNTPEARKVFIEHHGRELIDKGVAGFKLDECDNSDYNRSNWSFPDTTQFPSGLDGEQMHSLIGRLYQDTIATCFVERNQRTLSQVRSSWALAASLPFVLYSDLYSHQAFIRGVVTSGFSGLLWSPEVRQASSAEDLIRRVQTVVFSPHALLNCWRIPHPPWKQVNLEKNLAGEFMDNWLEIEAICRKFFELRMGFLPYLYSAFARYHFEGIPPFRALVTDYPADPNTYLIDNQYMMGDSILVAPMTLEDGEEREVYLPQGVWCDFWTNAAYQGGKAYTIKSPIDRIPVFVKANSLIPYAKPVQAVKRDTCLEVVVKAYGDQCSPFMLYEDDGFTFDYQEGCYNWITLVWDPKGGHRVERNGKYAGQAYKIVSWEKTGAETG